MRDLAAARIVAASLRIPTGDGLSAPDVADLIDEMAGALETARSLRIIPRSIEPLVDPQVHTPTRINAYLKARGWQVLHEYPTVTQWRIKDLTRPGWAHQGSVVTVYGGPDWTEYSDYTDTVARLVVDLAGLHETGELQVLADIAEAPDV